MVLVGIDPGSHTGFAVSENRKLVRVECMKIHQAMQVVLDMHREGLISVHFEDARKRKWFGKMDAQQAKYGAAVREGAGAAKRDAAIWADFLADHGIPHQAVKPAAGMTKLDAARFERLTGWKGRTNEHSRDAAMIVWQR